MMDDVQKKQIPRQGDCLNDYTINDSITLLMLLCPLQLGQSLYAFSVVVILIVS